MKPTMILVLLAGTTVVAAGTWPVQQGNVRIMCSMTVGGSFDTKTAALSGHVATSTGGSPALDGSFTVDLRTLDTGISLRNHHLRDTYLEVDKEQGYDKAILSDIVLNDLNADAPQGKGSFAGSLTLHGVKKTVSGAVEVHKTGNGLQVKASFPLGLSDYNIAEPRYLGVGVKNTVQVEVVFTVSQE
jgi:polyisoprenoid-binding protein YceI